MTKTLQLLPSPSKSRTKRTTFSLQKNMENPSIISIGSLDITVEEHRKSLNSLYRVPGYHSHYPPARLRGRTPYYLVYTETHPRRCSPPSRRYPRTQGVARRPRPRSLSRGPSSSGYRCEVGTRGAGEDVQLPLRQSPPPR